MAHLVRRQTISMADNVVFIRNGKRFAKCARPKVARARSLGRLPSQNVQLMAEDRILGSQLLGRPKAIFNERPQQF